MISSATSVTLQVRHFNNRTNSLFSASGFFLRILTCGDAANSQMYRVLLPDGAITQLPSGRLQVPSQRTRIQPQTPISIIISQSCSVVTSSFSLPTTASPQVLKVSSITTLNPLAISSHLLPQTFSSCARQRRAAQSSFAPINSTVKQVPHV